MIASNIANADTPGYAGARHRFRAARCARPPAAATATGAAAATHAAHIAPARSGAHRGATCATQRQSQTNLDRNSVDMDRERAAFADNTVKYEATLRFINGGVRTMLDAIQGQ